MAVARAAVLSVLMEEMVYCEEGMEIDTDESAMLILIMASKL